MTDTTQTMKRSGFSFPKTELLLLLVAVFWGTSYGLTKQALLFTTVLTFIAIRFSMTFVALLPIIVMDFRKGRNKDWFVAIPTGGILSAIFFCEVFGVSLTTASNAAFLISLSVILTSFAEFFVNKSRVSPRMFLLVLICVAGVFLLTHSEGVAWTLNTGDYFILLAAVLRAMMVTLTKKFTDGREITTATLTALQSLTVALVAIVALSVAMPTAAISLPDSVTFWSILVYLVMFCTLFAFYVQNHAVRQISPTRASLLMGSEPLFGALFAVVWLQESLSAVQVLGGGMILASVLLASLKELPDRLNER
ncbi:DMT family transporter [Photobacterium halotolerans]|uniref:EamA family transporter n=1 Tax=Photobacterium halotolerans TaxID=265726 RepID=A0A7X4XV42_9GAMM|nr:EamA family transporter [Photobacterium halotolerans]NAW66920.1 EamA family transporter [Photobacterium halotolerans]NAW86141.1 EamA family transporter [Photobacterium halotolerans]NAX45837.1 EamA family transporter [Photobacterium halotolerans]